MGGADTKYFWDYELLKQCIIFELLFFLQIINNSLI